MNKNNQGFTLIELLVVIAIIALLGTLAAKSLGNAKVKTRDARRVADLKQIQKALELYALNTGDYPRTDGDWYKCSCVGGECNSNWFAVLQPLIDEELLSVLPSDPLNIYSAEGSYYCYEYLAKEHDDPDVSSMICNGRPRTDYEYVLLFSSETTTFDLPELTNNVKYDYCLAGPLRE